MAGEQRHGGRPRLVATNIFVFLVILWATNSCSSILIDLQYVFEPYFAKHDERAELPNYSDRDKARALFREFDLLHTEYVPFSVWRRLPFDGRYTHVDENGERVHPSVTRGAGRTVRFFGGSTMWGTGSTDEETIPAQFDVLAPGVEVHNHGESGFVSRQSLERLISLTNDGAKTDVVVFYDGYNDVRTLCRFDVSLQGHSREQKIRNALRPSNNLLRSLTGSTIEVLEFLLPKAWVGGERGGDGDAPSRCHVDEERPGQVVATLLGNWRVAREVARLAGAEFIAVLQPVAALSKSRTDRLVNDATFKGRAHELVYPSLRKAIAAADEPWVHDLSQLYDRDEYIFVDAAHVSPNGNRLMAAELYRILEPLLAAPTHSEHNTP